MKKWAFVVMALLVGACSNTQKIYYQLPETSIQARSTASRSLWLEQVSVANYLSLMGLVYQLSDVKYMTASHHVWASPLDQQLQQTLINHLNNAMPGWLVTDQPVGKDQDILQVSVNGFHGRYDGKVIIRGTWLLEHKGQWMQQPFNIELEQHEAGYDALVRTLALGWQQQAQKMAAQIKNRSWSQ